MQPFDGYKVLMEAMATPEQKVDHHAIAPPSHLVRYRGSNPSYVMEELKNAVLEVPHVFVSSVAAFKDVHDMLPRILPSDYMDIADRLRYYWKKLSNSSTTAQMFLECGLIAGFAEKFDDLSFTQKKIVIERFRTGAQILLKRQRQFTQAGCFFEDDRNSSMWGTYGGNGDGICLTFSKIEEAKSPIAHSAILGQFGLKLRPMLYQDSRPSVLSSEMLDLYAGGMSEFVRNRKTESEEIVLTATNDSPITRTFFTKNCQYKHEAEWRLISNQNKNYVPLHGYVLASVTIGDKLKSDFSKAISDLCEENKIDLIFRKPLAEWG